MATILVACILQSLQNSNKQLYQFHQSWFTSIENCVWVLRALASMPHHSGVWCSLAVVLAWYSPAMVPYRCWLLLSAGSTYDCPKVPRMSRKPRNCPKVPALSKSPRFVQKAPELSKSPPFVQKSPICPKVPKAHEQASDQADVKASADADV